MEMINAKGLSQEVEDRFTCAKYDDKNYLIKADRRGGFYDPYAICGHESDLWKIDQLTQQPEYTYEKVSLEVYQAYVKFLKGRVSAHFNYAEALHSNTVIRERNARRAASL